MARVQFGGGITNIVGSIGGNTFQSNRSGYIVRSRGFTRKALTTKQITALNNHQYLLYEWQALSFADKLTWDTLSLAHDKTNKYGQTKTLTGLNWFLSCNKAMQLCGLPLFTSAPVYEAPSAVPLYTLSVNITDITLTADTPKTVADNYMSVWATPPIRNKTTSFRSNLKFMTCVQSDFWDNLDLTSYWETATGLSWPADGSVGSFQIGVLIQAININSGITSEGLLLIEPYS